MLFEKKLKWIIETRRCPPQQQEEEHIEEKTMASIQFPEEVFSLIKSFTKPEIWECECCEEQFNKQKNEPVEELVYSDFCKECYEIYLCPCGSISKELVHFQCEACSVWCCGECEGLYDSDENEGYCAECCENEDHP